jgi:undecaprenyl pyrophosphate phosphatase UppP
MGMTKNSASETLKGILLVVGILVAFATGAVLVDFLLSLLPTY